MKRYPKIETVKTKIIDGALLVGSVLGLVVFTLSFIEYLKTGFNVSHLIDFCVLVIFLSCFIFRNKLKLILKVFIIIIGLLTFIITDLYKWGVFSDTRVLIVAALFIIFLGFSIRRTLILYIIIAVGYFVIAYLHINSLIDINVNFNDRFFEYSVWITNFLLITIVSFVIILIIRQFNFKFLDLLQNLEEKNNHILEKEQNYADLFNASPNAIFIHDSNGKIIEVNSSVLTMYKYDHFDQVYNLTIEDFSLGSPPYDNEHAALKVKEAHEKGHAVFEWKAKTKSGEVFWTEVTLKSLKIGGEDRVMAIVKNIDQQKRNGEELENYKNNLQKLVNQRTEELQAINKELNEANDELLNLNESIANQKKVIEENEKRLSTIINNQGEGLAIVDLEETIKEANAKTYEIFGISKGELIGRNLKEFIKGDDWEEVLKQTQKRKDKIRSSYEVKLHLKDGTIKNIILTGAPDFDDEGNIIGVIANFRDISDIKKREEKLKDLNEELESSNEELNEANEELINLNENIQQQKKIIEEKEKRLSTIIDNQGEGLAIVDLTETVRKANFKTCEIFGVKEDEILGRNLKDFIKDKDWEKVLEQTKLRKRNIRSSYEVNLHLDDGTLKNIILTGSPDYDDEGKVRGTIANFRDITLIKQREKKLKELNEELETSNEELSEAHEKLKILYENIEQKKKIIEEKEQRLSTIIENQGEGLGINDIDENFIFASPAAHEIFEMSQGSLIGRNLKEFFDDNEWKKILNQTKHRKKNIRSSYEAVITLKNGKKKHLIVTGSPDLDADGNVVGTIANFRDISDRIEHEQQLKELNEELIVTNEELYESNEELSFQKDELQRTIEKLKQAQKQLIRSEKMASLGILAAGVAHEINNPLNFIMGGVTGLENACKGKTDSDKEEVEPMLNAIKEGVNRAANIVSGLGHFSREGEAINEDCFIHDIIDNCLTILHSTLKRRIEVTKEFYNEPIIVKGNEGKLHQVFLNILSNSEQAILEDGIIEITTDLNDKFAEIVIEDDGMGIKEEHMHRITDPFFTTKEPGKGTGLGLSIVHQILEEHNGSIDFYSHEGIGTKVIVKLPIY